MGSHYLRLLKQIRDVNLSSVCDTEERDIPDVRLFSDYKEMLDKDNPDFVVVTSPEQTHAEMLKEILARNIDVLVEKPVCLTEDEAEELRNTETDSKIFVSYPIRFSPVLTAAAKILLYSDCTAQEYELNWLKDRQGDKRQELNVMVQEGTHTLDLILHNLVRFPSINPNAPEPIISDTDLDSRESAFYIEWGDKKVLCNISYSSPIKQRQIRVLCQSDDEQHGYWLTMEFDYEIDPDGTSIDLLGIEDCKTGFVPPLKPFKKKGLDSPFSSYRSNKLYEQLSAVLNYVRNPERDPTNPFNPNFDPRLCTLEQGLRNVRITNEILEGTTAHNW